MGCINHIVHFVAIPTQCLFKCVGLFTCQIIIHSFIVTGPWLPLYVSYLFTFRVPLYKFLFPRLILQSLAIDFFNNARQFFPKHKKKSYVWGKNQHQQKKDRILDKFYWNGIKLHPVQNVNTDKSSQFDISSI